MEVSKQRVGNGPRRAQDIFGATLGLLAEAGYHGLTMESVAARSGVNKTTLYRWWPSKDALLAAALADSNLLTFEVPDTGTLRGDLAGIAAAIHRLLTDETTAPIAIAVLAAAPNRPQLATIGRLFFADRMERERPLFERAVERGELSRDADPVTIMDALAGAIWFRMLLRGEAITPDHLRAIVDLLLTGVETR